MKRIVASVGVVALGAAVIQTSNAQGIGDSNKPWTFSAALRGFYDDNVNTASNNEIDTFGFEVSPSIAFRTGMDQTTFSLAYTYSFKYYDERPGALDDHNDQTHTVAASLLHAFNERTSISLRDSFVIGQEPDLDPSFASFQRISGDNIRNYASVKVNHQITPLVGVEAGYRNSLFDYDNEGFFVATGVGGVPLGVYPLGVIHSRSGLLDRIEHGAHLDSRWTLANNSVVIVGYQFGVGCYTGDEFIGVAADPNIANNMLIKSSSRDYTSHYGYVGLEHTFRPDLTGSIRGGVRFTDYYNSPNDDSSVSPYVQASLRYLYAQNSSLEVGVSHDQSATDAFTIQGDSITTDADALRVYASLTHQITPDLTGSLTGTFQNNSYNGGTIDGDTEQYYILNAALTYHFTPNLAGTLSYNFDHVESEQGLREYDRNRIFLGAVFTY